MMVRGSEKAAWLRVASTMPRHTQSTDAIVTHCRRRGSRAWRDALNACVVNACSTRVACARAACARVSRRSHRGSSEAGAKGQRERGQLPRGRARVARHLRLLEPGDEREDEDEARDGAADDRVEGDREEREPGVRSADVQRGDDADGDREPQVPAGRRGRCRPALTPGIQGQRDEVPVGVWWVAAEHAVRVQRTCSTRASGCQIVPRHRPRP